MRTEEVGPRFEVGQYIPHDPATREAMGALRRLPRPVDLGPCPVHAPAAPARPGPPVAEPGAAAQ
jgi:hypothetical protein